MQWWDLSANSGAPPADSDPVAYYSAATNTKHVIYRSADGHLHEIWWPLGGTPAHVDLTLFALAPPAVDRPAAFTIDGPNSHHVIYRGTDNQIHEITWTPSPSASAGRQPDWRWCNKCQGLFYGGGVDLQVPDRRHPRTANQSSSVDYILPYGAPINASSQDNWRWCNKCQGLFYGGGVAASKCPTGGTHTPPDQSSSVDYILPYGAPINASSQDNWRWCNKCQGLF